MSSARRSRWSATSWWSGRPAARFPGAGDGVAYVFDANVDSTTFGDLLATLTIPDPGASNHAQFGAAVGTTNTNIVIGAPGNNGGVGEAYEFEGDTTQSNFGDLLLDIPNPTSQPDSDFGAAVAGTGNNVIVGAPAVDLAGAIGGVFLFDGTTGGADHVDRESGPVDHRSALARRWRRSGPTS